MPTSVTTRFAPSPTGHLHLGHAYSALLNHGEARRQGGRFVLRLEDIDQGRCRPEYEHSILEDLTWLGLHWDGAVLRQSERFDHYKEALESLSARGLLYRCFKTRRELTQLAGAPHGSSKDDALVGPLSQNEERARLGEGQPFSWRLHMDAVRQELSAEAVHWQLAGKGEPSVHSAPLTTISDEVLARKDFPASYHLASVLDDAAQGVNLVWRGEDLADAIPLHRVLQQLLGLPEPLYRHHRLITDNQGRRLAKRDKAATIKSLRDKGVDPTQIRQQLGLTR